MKNERIKELENELKYLTDNEREKEITINIERLQEENCNVKEIAKEIYLKRGLDLSKIKSNGLISDLINQLNEMAEIFGKKDKDTKNKMVLEIVYTAILFLLMKLPFDLIRDIGYEYIEFVSTNQIINTIWSLIFLLLYTITILCSLVIFVKKFNKKYK